MVNGLVKPVPLEYMRFPTKTGLHISEWREQFLRRERSEAVRTRSATTFDRPFYLVQVVLPHAKAAREEVGVMLAGQRVLVSDNNAKIEAAVVRRDILSGDVKITLAFDIQLDGADNIAALRAYAASLVTTSAIGLLQSKTEFVEETAIGVEFEESRASAQVVKKALHFNNLCADELKRRVETRRPELVVKTWDEGGILFLTVDAVKEQVQLAFKAVGKLIPHVNGNGNGTNGNGSGNGSEIRRRSSVAEPVLHGNGHL